MTGQNMALRAPEEPNDKCEIRGISVNEILPESMKTSPGL